MRQDADRLARESLSLRSIDSARSSNFVSGVIAVSIRGHTGRLVTRSSSSLAESAFTTSARPMVPLMGPPARIFSSFASFLHNSSVGRMNSLKKISPSSTLLGRPSGTTLWQTIKKPAPAHIGAKGMAYLWHARGRFQNSWFHDGRPF